MKKTIPTTLAGTLFYIEEDAYERLSKYLESIKKHFASDPDSEEIIKDIESRIAEQFLEIDKENKHGKNHIVTLQNVEALISSMGNAADFDSGEEKDQDKNADKENNSDTTKKKLFRNPDDVIIGGVASGLAAYFGIDPTIMRLAFVLVVLFGGSGVLIYIILWIIVPEAKTGTEKLQMRGERVTLESVKELAKEKVNEVKAHKGTFRKIIGLPFLIIGKILHFVIPFIRKMIGLIITVAASFLIFVILFVLTVVVFNIQSPYVDFPLMQIGHHFLIYILIFAGFFCIFVPTLFLLFLGIKIMAKKNIFHIGVVLSLVGVFSLSAIVGGVIMVRILPEYRNFMATSPIYQQTTVDMPLADFTGISLKNDNKVTLSEGDAFKVSLNGTSENINNISLKVEDGILKIGSKDSFKICIFCGNSRPEINIVMPVVDSLSLANGSALTAADIKSDALKLDLANASHISISMDVKNLTVEESNASWSTLTGKAATANFKLSNASSTNAQGLAVDAVTINAQNGSVGTISPTKTLSADLQNGSLVFYNGNPKIEKNLSNGSRLEPKGKDLEDSSDEEN